MIRFSRPPSPLDGDPEVARAREALGRAVAAEPKQKRTYNDEIWRRHRGPLIEAQHGKCAYCEGRIHEAQTRPRVDHFAPKSVYAWLAYSWENWLITCEVCNTAKGTHFPLEGGGTPPAGAGQPFTATLLNPYDDDPEAHLVHGGGLDGAPSGHMAGKTPRGDQTITTCHLNRPELVKDRFPVEQVAVHWLHVVLADGDDAETARRAVVEMGGDDRAYAGAVRRVAAALLEMSWEDFAGELRACRRDPG